MNQSGTNLLAKKKGFVGRIFVFTEKSTKDKFASIKKLLEDLDVDSSILSEIKIDSKPHLKQIMEKESNKSDTPQIFLNSNYFGDFAALLKESTSNPNQLVDKIRSLPENLGPLYAIYKKQSELFEIYPPDFYFPRLNF